MFRLEAAEALVEEVVEAVAEKVFKAVEVAAEVALAVDLDNYSVHQVISLKDFMRTLLPVMSYDGERNWNESTPTVNRSYTYQLRVRFLPRVFQGLRE